MKFLSGHSLVAATALLAGALSLAQSTPDKGKAIVDRAVTALGGQNFLTMRTRTATGRIYSFFRDQLSGLDIGHIYTEYVPATSAKGLAVREREVLGKKQDYSYLFLEDQGWDITFRGARPVEDETWNRYHRTTENDILYFLRCRYSEPGLSLDYIGSDVHLSTHVETVEITDAQDRTIRVDFDYNTGLPVREIFKWMDPDSKQHNDEVIEYDKWRNAGSGVMWPFSIERSRNGYKTYQLFANTVAINDPLPRNIFDLPPGTKVLKRVE